MQQLSREITVVTPENVTITYELAGPGSRTAAYLLDWLIQLAAFIILWFAWVKIAVLIGMMNISRSNVSLLGDIWFGVAIVGSFLLYSGYFIYFETAWNGQTPGKKKIGIRVVREGGAPVDFSSTTVRNIIRLLEFGLGMYVLSLLFIFFSPKYKRLGDYAAGTIVVKERTPNAVTASTINTAQIKKYSEDTREAAFMVDINLLTKEEIEAVKRFTQRRTQLKPELQEELAKQLAQSIRQRLGMQLPEPPFNYVDYIEMMYSRYMEDKVGL